MRFQPIFFAACMAGALSTGSQAKAPPFHYGSFDATHTTIYDRRTTLQWERGTTRTPMSFEDAKTECGNRRLPSVKELQTLVDEQPHVVAGQTRYLDIEAFPSDRMPVQAPYWSDSAVSTRAHLVAQFDKGTTVALDDTEKALVLCVISGPTLP